MRGNRRQTDLRFRKDYIVDQSSTLDSLTIRDEYLGAPTSQSNQVKDQRFLRREILQELTHDGSNWPTNGDESSVPLYLATFTKALPHDAQGRVDEDEAKKLLSDLRARKMPDVTLGGSRKFVQPRGANSLNLVGQAPSAFSVPPAPRFSSAETAGEMVELYCKVLCRDIAYADYDTNPIVGDCVGYMNALSDYKGPKPVTRDNIFRGDSAGDLIGPYISQLFLLDVMFWPHVVDRIAFFPTRSNMNDRMVTMANYVDVQNGNVPESAPVLAGLETYLGTGRDLAYSVWNDLPGEIFILSVYIAHQLGVPIKVGPYPTATEVAFTGFSPGNVLSVIGKVADSTIKAAWYAKWFAHRRSRPEKFGGEVENVRLSSQNPGDIHSDLLTNGVLADILSGQGNHLLSQVFPEGSPTHPSYPAGHAVLCGACATVLKAFYDEDFVFPSSYQASANGISLVSTGDVLTWGNEIDKLSSNISLGRDWAGVHYRSDGVEGIILGEKVARGVLQDVAKTYSEFSEGEIVFTYKTYLGEDVEIRK